MCISVPALVALCCYFEYLEQNVFCFGKEALEFCTKNCCFLLNMCHKMPFNTYVVATRFCAMPYHCYLSTCMIKFELAGVC